MEEALDHLVMAGDRPRAIHLVIDNRHALLNNAQFNRLSRGLNRLPSEALLHTPFLITTQALLGWVSLLTFATCVFFL